MVDPLDGTKEFIKRNGEFTVNIALIHRERPILGVLYAPVLQWLYWGSAAAGAWKQEGSNEAFQMKKEHSKEVKTIVASRSHLSQETQAFIEQYPGVEVISMGSSLKFMLVAEGKAQVYPRFAPTMEWDTAAGQAICEYAGLEVIDWGTKENMLYNREKLLNNWFLVN
jgi:3'(2'), 5'-bisphosphate nucleotidase